MIFSERDSLRWPCKKTWGVESQLERYIVREPNTQRTGLSSRCREPQLEIMELAGSKYSQPCL